ncbi:MAG: tetratricopeptide repeat protein [Holophagales bacterium]|jgi:TolA-binding protein|nr:tetratricopeptide repeat protein [Holophagales bacterium]
MQRCTRNKFLSGFAAASLTLVLGCNPQEQFKRPENEVNDLKVEIYRQRQEIQDLAKKSEEYRKAAADERTKENQFRADTQESLRQIKDSTQAMSNRINSAATQRPTTPARTQTRPDPNYSTAPAAELQPDEQLFAMAEKDFNAGNYSNAVDAVDNLLKYFPDSDNIMEALYLKGRALMALKSYVKAQESFQKLCTSFPSSDKYRAAKLNIGKCQEAQGNVLAAINTFEDIVRLYSTSPEGRSAKDILQDLKNNR